MGRFDTIFGSAKKPATPAASVLDFLTNIVSKAAPIKLAAGVGIKNAYQGGAAQELADYLKGKEIAAKSPEHILVKGQDYRDIGATARTTRAGIDATMGAINETGPVVKASKGILAELKSLFSKKSNAASTISQSVEELAALGRKAETAQVAPSQVVQTIQGESLPPNLSQEVDPVKKVIAALEEAKPLRGKQETIYTAERSKRLGESLAIGSRTSGEAGFRAELGALKGELPKVQFDEIRSKLGQPDIDAVFNKIKDSPLLNEWDKITARKGLSKLFGEYGGVVPTEGEIALLSKALGPDLVTALKDKRTLFAKFKELGLQLANIPRSVMASVDMSAPFRQGLFFTSRPKQFFPAFKEMFQSFGSEKTFKAIQEEIVRRPTFELMRDARLHLPDMDNILAAREERFMSNLAEKIPGVGKLVRASGRAYTGFLNKVRADVFDDLIIKAEKLGLNPTKDRDLVKAISGYINTATGRGSLGAFERAAPLLNSFFFSPRLMASRLSLLNPVYYIKQPSFVRKEALKDLFTVAGSMLSILTLAKFAGADVGADPRNSDFGKIKIGNTRFDIGGGFLQYIVLASRLITGEYVSSTTGKKTELGDGYNATTRLDILARGVESKEAPLFSLMTDLLKGKDFAGQPISLTKEAADLFIPLFIKGIVELYQEDPSLLPLGLPSFFGTGVQSYKPTKPKSENRFKF